MTRYRQVPWQRENRLANQGRKHLEGIVAKRKTSKYIVTEKPSPNWIKVKNPTYCQAEGREELFER
jgi:ATP-dependent DNA ligase